jgi:hypothetical protein
MLKKAWAVKFLFSHRKDLLSAKSVSDRVSFGIPQFVLGRKSGSTKLPGVQISEVASTTRLVRASLVVDQSGTWRGGCVARNFQNFCPDTVPMGFPETLNGRSHSLKT